MQRPMARVTRPIRVALTAALAIALVAGCSSTASPSPTTAPQTATPGAPSATPAVTSAVSPITTEAATPAPTQPGQSETDWERIWDDLPAGFPSYPGAHPTETGQGPASAILDAGTAKPPQVTDFYRTAFASIGYDVISSDGPREDGSYELIVSDQGDCDVRITAAPLGGSTIITVMYGAHCPFS